MHDDARHRIRAGLVALLALLPACRDVRAEGVYGTLQLQYQKLEDTATLVSGDNALLTQRVSQELWLRTLDLHHQSYLRQDLMLESNLRYSDQSYTDRGDVTRTPYGSLRLMHPWFQFLASHQPALSRTTLSAATGLTADAATSREVTTYNRETILSGHVAVPRWPQADLSWIRRVRDGGGSATDANTARNARFTLDRDRWSTYAGVNDQVLSSATPGAGRNTQQVWSTGGSYHYVPRPDLAFHAQADASDVRGVESGIRQPSTSTESASLNGDWRPGKKWVDSFTYQWRHVDFGNLNNPPQSDEEGALLARYAFTPHASIVSGGGIRTVRNTLADGTTSVALQKYVTSVAAVDARVRRNWTMTGGLSHTSNWDPDHSLYHIETMSGASRAQLNRRLQLDGSLQFSANSDTAAAANRYSNAWNVRLQGTPLRTVQLAVSLRDSRSGPGVLRAASASDGVVLDGTWRPTSSLQLIGQYGNSVEKPSVSGSNGTRSLSAKYQPTPQWQWYGTWTRADQTVFVSSAGRLSSREVVSSRVQYEPSRWLASTAGLTYNDPGKATESRRLDLTFTWSFGR